MNKYASLITILATPALLVNVAFGCHIIPNPPSCPSCPPGSTLVDINFEDHLAGTLVGEYDHLQHYTSANNGGIDAGLGFSIDINNNNGPQVGALYDTDARKYTTYDDGYGYRYTDSATTANRVEHIDSSRYTGRDPDLEVRGDTSDSNWYNWSSSWAGGNMEENNLGNALIIQEYVDGNDIDQGHLDYIQGQGNSSYKTAPDDDANGGYISLQFENAMSGFGFTWVDLDENATSTNITFFDSTGASVQVDFSEFANGGDFSAANRGSNNTSGEVIWGDRKANRIDTISVSELNQVMNTSLSDISAVTFNLSGSGGITHVNYCYNYNAVPEASTYIAGSGILFLIGFHFIRRRKKNAE